MAQNLSQFDRLPIEIQCDLLGYLNKPSIKAFRLVSQSCNSIVQNTNLCPFSSCTLSDSSYKHILASNETVSEIRIQNLTAKIGISSTRGVILGNATGISIQAPIHPLTLMKVLKTCNQINGFGLASIGEIAPSIETIFSTSNRFEFVTRFSLTSKLHSGITEKEVAAFKKLSKTKRFPALKMFSVDWTQGRGVSIRKPLQLTFDKGSLVLAIYLAIHRILWNHRETVTAIKWNLSGIQVPFLEINIGPCMEEYMNLKSLMRDVALSNVAIKKFPNEGQLGFDLSQTLINAQSGLQKFTFNHIMQMSQAVTNMLFSPITIPLQSSKLTLEEATIQTDVLPFSIFAGCDALKKLWISTRIIIITEGVPFKRLTHLYLDVKVSNIQVENGQDQMDWIFNNMPELTELEMRFWRLSMIPEPDTFKKFFIPPKMVRLSFKFHARNAFYQEYVESKLFEVVFICRFTPGVSVDWIVLPGKMPNRAVFDMKLSVDRKVFTGFVSY